MTIEKTPAFVATVRSDHTVELPAEVPVGATVAVIVMPDEGLKAAEQARSARFATTLAAVRAASLQETSQPTISDEALDTLIERAKKQNES